MHQLWLMWLGSGVIGGIGLGLGYISPVSTLVKWFPDRRGMATGMAIMGFGGGAMIGAPLADLLMNYFKTPTSVGVWETFLAMGAIYFVFMMIGAFRYRLPPAGLAARRLDAAERKTQRDDHRSINVHLKDAHKTPQFWLIWWVLCLNVSAGIGVIGMASPMLQEIFAGKLIGLPDVGFNAARRASRRSPSPRSPPASPACCRCSTSAAGSSGRRCPTISAARTPTTRSSCSASRSMRWRRRSADMGAKLLFVGAFCIILSMYGGGFATVPAYLADMFGTQFVGAIHGRLLTAWSTAGIIGPVVVNYIREAQLAAGVPRDQLYDYHHVHPVPACWWSA